MFYGELTTPSVVYFESASSVLVGSAARTTAAVDPDTAVALIKRQMGKITGQPRLPEPVKIAAHHPRLLKALGQMEGGQAAATSVPEGRPAPSR